MVKQTNMILISRDNYRVTAVKFTWEIRYLWKMSFTFRRQKWVKFRLRLTLFYQSKVTWYFGLMKTRKLQKRDFGKFTCPFGMLRGYNCFELYKQNKWKWRGLEIIVPKTPLHASNYTLDVAKFWQLLHHRFSYVSKIRTYQINEAQEGV